MSIISVRPNSMPSRERNSATRLAEASWTSFHCDYMHIWFQMGSLILEQINLYTIFNISITTKLPLKLLLERKYVWEKDS